MCIKKIPFNKLGTQKKLIYKENIYLLLFKRLWYSNFKCTMLSIKFYYFE